SDGTLSTATLGGAGVGLTVSPAAPSAYRITAASTTPTAGASDALTITLVDQYQNVETGFSGTKGLTFAGLGTPGSGTGPTVTNNVPSAVALGSSTTISFSCGTSSAGGTLVAYNPARPTPTPSDGTLSTTTLGGTGV